MFHIYNRKHFPTYIIALIKTVCYYCVIITIIVIVVDVKHQILSREFLIAEY